MVDFDNIGENWFSLNHVFFDEECRWPAQILVFQGKGSNLAGRSEFPLNPGIRLNLVPGTRRLTKIVPHKQMPEFGVSDGFFDKSRDYMVCAVLKLRHRNGEFRIGIHFGSEKSYRMTVVSFGLEGACR
jgi:hypothetical protein